MTQIPEHIIIPIEMMNKAFLLYINMDLYCKHVVAGRWLGVWITAAVTFQTGTGFRICRRREI